MIKKLLAYNLEELEKHEILSYAKDLNKSQVISQVQLDGIKNKVKSNLYSPSIFMRILLFILSLIGLSTVLGPVALIMGIDSEVGIRVEAFVVGISILLLLDFVLIKESKHYKSGVTEAALVVGLVLFSGGLLGEPNYNPIIYLVYGLAITLFAAIRYLNSAGLIAALGFAGAIVFQVLYNFGGLAQALIPFAIMVLYALLFWGIKKLQSQKPSFIFDDYFTLSKVFCLLMVYVAGNYFVVRELSVELMGVNIEPGGDIPFAFLFYFFTGFIPLGYLFYGIKRKSILFIRVALLTVVFSIITLKIYFSLGAPIVTITLSGAIMIGLALVLLRYLKEPKYGFTREKLLHDKWDSSELTAFVVSQSLSGHQVEVNDENSEYGGGSFGGGGAGSEF
jgi:uncharacterized membrane protein YgcG